MKTINFKEITMIGDNINKTAKQLIELLKAIRKVKKYDSGQKVVSLLIETATKTEADLSDWVCGLSKKTLAEITNGEVVRVTAEFNGITITVDDTSTIESVVGGFHSELEKSSEEYKKSDKYKADQLKDEQERNKMQLEANALMQELPKLNFKDNVQLLEWLCRIQPATDRIGVKTTKTEIIKIFNDNGFATGANTGKNFKENDEDNFARYIIGHALSGLDEFGTIHHMVIKFTNDWKQKFNKKLDVLNY